MDVFLIILAIVVLVVVVAALLNYLSAERDKPNEVRMTEDGYLEIPTFIRRTSTIPVKDVSASKTGDIRCRFKFICSRKWQDLESTDSEDVKFCTHCEQSEYLAKTMEDFDQFAEERKCTYWAGSEDGRGPYLDRPMTGRLVIPHTSIFDKVRKFFTLT